MIKRSTSSEVARLIGDVRGDDPVRREAAIARLAVIGPRAVDRLLIALADTEPPPLRAAWLQALERIGDARALPAAEAHLDARDQDLAICAVGVLRALLRNRREEIADRALERLTTVVLDPARADPVRSAALDALHDLPADVVIPIVERLRDDPSDVMRRQAGCSGPLVRGRGDRRATGSPLERFADGELPDDPEAVTAAIAEAGPTVPLPVLHRLIVGIRAREQVQPSSEARLGWAVARGVAHQVLSTRGSRVALYDLRETLQTMPERLSVGMMAALGEIGDASCLDAMADAWAGAADPWVQSQLADAFRRVCERERITRRHSVLRRVLKKHPDLEKAGS